MTDTKRWFWVGSRPEVGEALAEVFGGPPVDGAFDVAAGDTVVVDPKAERAQQQLLPGGHAYSGVRALKQERGVAVYVLVDEGDPIGVQLARFALADGVLTHRADGSICTDELRTGGPGEGDGDDGLGRHAIGEELEVGAHEAGGLAGTGGSGDDPGRRHGESSSVVSSSVGGRTPPGWARTRQTSANAQ